MATAIGSAARRVVLRRFSSGGKVLGEEEKAAENVYIKKVEQEKLEKLARKGPKPEETTASGSGAAPADVKASTAASSTPPADVKASTAASSTPPADVKASTAASSTPPGSSTEKVSTDKYRNYAVVAGTITALGALGWYLKSGGKKQEEVRD